MEAVGVHPYDPKMRLRPVHKTTTTWLSLK